MPWLVSTVVVVVVSAVVWGVEHVLRHRKYGD